MKGVLLVAGKEIREGMRNRWVAAATLLLAALALTLTFLGAAPAGRVGADALDVVVVSLSSLSIFLLPLIALLISHDAVVGEMERGTMLLLLSYPLARWQVLLGKFLGQLAILAIATLIGYGAAALALAATGQAIAAESWGAFAAMLGSSVLLGAAFIALGTLVSALVRDRGTAAGIAVGLWLLLVLIWDMALLGLLVADQGEIPYANCVGNVIDSGRFAETQQMALDLADWNGFATRRAAAQARGRLRGIGIGYFIEASGGQPFEWARVTLTGDGRAKLTVGTFSHGQGHETAYAQVLSEKLGIPYEKIDLIQGDTDVVEQGAGTGGSRSSQMGGVAISRTAELVLRKARRIAAQLLEASAEDVQFEDGAFRVAGTDLAVSWDRVIAAAHDPARLPEGEAPGLDEKLVYRRDTECNFPNGCHVAEVEIDPETGQVTLVNYAAVDDVGVPINPMLVHGQCHGGIMAGIGQAMLEHAQYDPESGQFLTATFQDYAMPRAADAPEFHLGLNVVPCPSNDLGVKGAGEGGACGAPPAVVSAVCDALGVAHLDMPLTPEKVWQALRRRESAAA